MIKLQEKLDFLLDKYSVSQKITLKDWETALIDGNELPLLPHRSERKFIELKNIVNNGTLQGISVMRVARIVEKGLCVYNELYRELDICRFVLQREIKSIMVMENDNVMNVVATTDDGVVCTIEISATLKKGEAPKEKHEIISQRGIACDIVVDAQLKQDSVYVFADKNEAYTDVDFELYGLTDREVTVVRAAFNIAQSKNFEEIKMYDNSLRKLVKMAEKSAKTGEKEVM